MAEALGIAASIIGASDLLIQTGKRLRLSSLDLRDGGSPRLKTLMLMLEIEIARVTSIQGSITSLDVSSSLVQDCLRILESVVHRLIRVAEETTNHHRKMSKSRLRSIMLENAIIKQEKELGEIQRLLDGVQRALPLSSDTSSTLLLGERNSTWLPEWSRTGAEIHWGYSLPKSSIHQKSIVHEHGLRILSDPGNDATVNNTSATANDVDIVFVHGLNSSSSSTWRAVDMYWPKDLLPVDFPKARIMTFDYDSRVSVSSPLLANNLSTEKTLVDILIAARRSQGQKILFCAHSFGGILLQKAVAYCWRTRRSEQSSRDFLSSVKGFVFLGTPYLGSRSMSVQTFIEKLIPLAPRTLLDSLAPSIESTVRELDVFYDFIRNEKTPIYSFYESQPTTTPSGPIKISIPDQDIKRNDPSFLNGNHDTMCKFQTAQDSGYVKIVEAMGDIIGATQDSRVPPQRLSRRGIDQINRFQPLEHEQQRSAPSQSLIQEAQQHYSEQLRVFLFQLRSRIPPKRSWSDRLSGSCDWILETNTFKQWQSSKGSIFLVLRGISGSGRTKIAQYLVDYFKGAIFDGQARIREQRRITLSHFCDWTLPARDQALTCLYELLLQLLESNSSLFREIYRKTNSPPIMYSDLEALVLRLLQTSSIREINIIIDGLDECKVESFRQIQKTIDQLPNLLPGRKLRVLLSTNILDVIPSTARQHSTELSLNSFKKERNKYIKAFINERLMDSTNKNRYTRELVMQISEGLSQKASLTISSEDSSSVDGTQDDQCAGNFIWISSAIAVIENGRSAGEMKQALNSLPSKLGPLYDSRLRRIPADDRGFVAKALHFIRCSFRSLETKALAFALTIKSHHTTMREVFEEQILDLQGVLAMSTGDLVVFNNDCVSFAHQTFSKYLDETASKNLTSLQALNISKTHAELATSCLRCLMLDHAMEDDTTSLSPIGLNEEVWTISFLPYAETYWFEHLRQAPYSPELMSLMTSFFSSPKLELWLATRKDAQPELLLPQSSSAHHILAALGLFNSEEVLQQLPWPISDRSGEPSGPNQRDSTGMTALHYAIANNALESIGFLEEQGSNVAATDDQHRSCLHFAVYSGNIKLIEKFMSEPPIHPSLLSLAIERRNWDVVDLILDKLTTTPRSAGEDWKKWKEPKTGQGIIHRAVLSRRGLIVEKLLDKDIDLSLADDRGRTALHWAAKIAERSIVEVLIDHSHSKLPLDTKDDKGDTALHLATAAGDIKIVKMLVEQGADLDIVNKAEQVPLHFAAMYGYESIVNFLLDEGSPVNTNSKHASPLHMASAWGWHVVANRLIRDGADINCRDEKGRSPLYLAAYNGSEVMAKLLVSFGAQVDAYDLEGRTPLHVAALGGWTPVVTLLLNAGAKVHAKDHEKRQTLHFAAASKNPSSELVERLIDAGAGLSQRNSKEMTAYACAIESGNTLIAELLDRFSKNQDTTAKEKIGHGFQVPTVAPDSASRLELLREVESREELEKLKIFASIGGERLQDA